MGRPVTRGFTSSVSAFALGVTSSLLQSSPVGLPLPFRSVAPTHFHSRSCTLTSSLFLRNIFSLSNPDKLSTILAMDGAMAAPGKEFPLGLDATVEEEYAMQSKLLKEFTGIPSIDKAWTFKSDDGVTSQAMFSVSQANLLANKRRKFILSANIVKESNGSVKFQWGPFPIEMTGVSAMVPSPSGSKLLVIRNSENDSPTQFEIWKHSQLEHEFQVPQSVHGSVYVDGWFEGISWNADETVIAYVAEEPSPSKPTFDGQGYKKGGSIDKDCSSWKGLGEWEEDWGETYAGKRKPALFVLSVIRGEVKSVKGISNSLSVGQVVWAPPVEGVCHHLVFVGWSSDPRKLGIKYCYNRPCALYVVKSPLLISDSSDAVLKDSVEDIQPLNLTQNISSAYFPVFSPGGKFLVFLSSKSAVDSGAHCATDSLHRIDWHADIKMCASAKVVDVIPVVPYAEDGYFPGLYCSGLHKKPWLSDANTLILPSYWHSSGVILSVNVLSGELKRITPSNSHFNWAFLALDEDAVIAVSSSPVDIPEIQYGFVADKTAETAAWSWSCVSSPIFTLPENVKSSLSSRQFSILKIPVRDVGNNLTKGAAQPYEAIFVSRSNKDYESDPLIVVLHGGPHSVSLSNFSKSTAFLSSLGFSLLIVNYRGSLGFGEEALQSLPGKIGSQDVNDVLAAMDYVIDTGIARPSRIAVVGGSHGGFLTTHLIGQAPDRFFAAAARNPVCSLASMVGITDIPDWCFLETYGLEGKNKFTEAPSAEDLALFHSKSPIAHISKVKTPTIFLIGAKDLRVPMSNGIQYARALKEKGVDTKILVFPEDVHGIERPQSDFESFLNIGVWFKKYCK